MQSGKYVGIQNMRFCERKNIVTSLCCFGLQRSVVCRRLLGNIYAFIFSVEEQYKLSIYYGSSERSS
jgi:hypothetical protein